MSIYYIFNHWVVEGSNGYELRDGAPEDVKERWETFIKPVEEKIG